MRSLRNETGLIDAQALLLDASLSACQDCETAIVRNRPEAFSVDTVQSHIRIAGLGKAASQAHKAGRDSGEDKGCMLLPCN